MGRRISTGREVFVTGGTGYIGRAMIAALLGRGHRVRALARKASVGRVPPGALVVEGDALDADSYVAEIHPGDTLVHLVGTPHPSPSKAAEFQSVDLVSARAAVAAATRAGVAHFVYLSVAQPAPMMRAYLAARAEGEQELARSGLTASVLRPWYVLGPGHRWPIVLVPFYALAGLFPPTREGARRLGLVTLPQMVAALVGAIEEPPPAGTTRIVDVSAIRRS